MPNPTLLSLTPPHAKAPDERLLSRQTIEQWATLVLNDPEQRVIPPGAEESPATFLGKYGLKTPKSVIAFLETPAGQTVLDQMAEEIMRGQEISKQSADNLRAHELLVHRIKCALLLWYLNKEAHAAKMLYELIAEQAQKNLERLHQAAKNQAALDAEYEAKMTEVINSYEAIIAETTGEEKKLHDEEQRLAAELDLLIIAGAQFNNQAKLYDSHLNEDAFIHILEADGISVNESRFRNAYDGIAREIQAIQQEVNQLIANGSDPKSKIAELNLLKMRLRILDNMQAVSEGRRFYHRLIVDGKEQRFALEQGDRLMMLDDNDKLMSLNPSDRPLPEVQERRLFLQKRGTLLVQDEDGQIYQLKAGENLDEIKRDSERSRLAREEAKISYERAKLDIIPVRMVMRHHLNSEQEVHRANVEKLEEQLTSVRTEHEVIANLNRLFQSLHADAKADYARFIAESSTAQVTAPAPRPIPAASHASPRPSPKARAMPNDELFQYQQRGLLKLIPKDGSTMARAYLNQELEKRLRMGGKPFTNQELIALVKKLAKLGIPTPLAQQVNDLSAREYLNPPPGDSQKIK